MSAPEELKIAPIMPTPIEQRILLALEDFPPLRPWGSITLTKADGTVVEIMPWDMADPPPNPAA